MESKSFILRKIAKGAYVLAVVCLLSGIVLSMINHPVSAAAGGAATPTSPSAGGNVPGPVGNEEITEEPDEPELGGEEATEVPDTPNHQQTDIPAPPQPFPTEEQVDDPEPQNGRPVFKGATPTPLAAETEIADKKPGQNDFSRAQKAQKSSGGASVSGMSMDEFQQAAIIEGSVSFTSSDQSLCQYEDGWIDATVTVSLPEGITAKLVTSWYVVHPRELNPGGPSEKHYSSFQVQDGDSNTFAAWWPGVRVGDDVVEIHWGAALVYDGEVIDTASLDYYWYDWVCQPPTLTPTPEEPEETPTPEVPEETPTPEVPEETPTPEVPEETPTPEVPEETPTPEVPEETPTPEVPEETPTPDPGGELTPTPEAPDDTPTPDPGGELTPTPEVPDDTPTPDPGGELTPTPDPGGEITPTSTPVSGENPTPTPGGGEITVTVVAEAASLGTPLAAVDLATLPAPLAASDNALLIPVTGADLTGWQILPVGLHGWQTLFINFGFIFLGIAFVLQGLINSRFK